MGIEHVKVTTKFFDLDALVEVYKELTERVAILEHDYAFLRRQCRIGQDDYLKTKDEMLGQQDFD